MKARNRNLIFIFLTGATAFTVVTALLSMFMIFGIGSLAASSPDRGFSGLKLGIIIAVAVIVAGAVTFFLVRYSIRAFSHEHENRRRFDSFWREQGKDIPTKKD